MTVTAFADQLNAASREAERIVEDVLAVDVVRRRFRRIDDKPGPFVSEMLVNVRRAAKAGRLRRCRHLPKKSPATAWLFGWRPGRLYCHRCAAEELICNRGQVEDDTCDLCRQVFPRLWSVLGAAGPFLVAFGACRPCFETETGQVG